MERVLFGLMCMPASIIEQSELSALGAESLVGIVLSQKNAVFCAAREHAVGFIRAFGDEIVNQNADVGFVSAQGEWFDSSSLLVAVDASDESLTRSLFVPCCAIDLSSEIEVLQVFGLKGMVQLGRREVVVFDRIPWPEHAHVLESWNLTHGVELNLFGQGCRKSVDVGLYGVASLWFNKYLVPVFVCKPVDFVFNAGAVAWSFALNGTIEHGALVQ